MKRARIAVPAAVIVLVFAATGCGDDDKSSDSGAGTTAPASTAKQSGPALKVAMSEFKFDPAELKAKAGQVTIEATNEGKTPHELVLLKTDEDPAKLPVENNRVEESASVGEIPETPAGASGSETFDLKPGKYAMVCNVPGHYQGGMYGSLTVSR